MLKIALDAMGGDQAPRVEVEGAVQAAREYGLGIILVGRKNVLRRELAQYEEAALLPIEIAHASEVISMSDVAGKAVRAKDSSIRVAAGLVRDGYAQGLISAGNTGATMAISKVVMGVLPGVHRPAIAQVFPTLQGNPGRPDRRWRERGLRAGNADRLRHHGRGLLPCRLSP